MTMHFWIVSSLCLIGLASVGGAPYYGKEVGDLTTHTHEVSGKVFLVDEHTIRIRNFNYDGLGPAGVFFVGFVGMADIQNTPSEHGMAIPDPEGESTRIRKYEDEDVRLKMPAGKTVRDVLWLSVWCVSFKVNFGHIQFSEAIRNDPPAAVTLEQFTRHAHDVRSGNITLLDSRTIMIKDLHYDGTGPAAWFIVGSNPSNIHYTGDTATPKVPNEAGSTDILSGYTGQTITITLPDGYDIRENNLRWLSIYCISATTSFGEVLIPENVNVIPVSAPVRNCEEMTENFQVGWQISGPMINFEFTGKLNDDEYMAFGLSGSNSAVSMDNADVVVAHWTGNQPRADDYNLNQRSQCNANGQGACPDSRVMNAVSSVTGIEGSRVNGITTVKFTRKLDTGDTVGDKVYMASGNQYIAWAIGKLNNDRIATKHDITVRSTDILKQLNFGRTALKKCRKLTGSTTPKPTPKAWCIPQVCKPTNNVFDVTIGPSGGDQGYSAITMANGWGIAIYINGDLIPELYVNRGENYTFRIRTGNDATNPAIYHPFYITDDSRGGHKQRTSAEKANIKIFAGLDVNGMPLPESVGPLCEYRQPSDIDLNGIAQFEDFKARLTQSPANCATSNSFTTLTWTVPMDAPDLLYYQCWEHNWLGWKIHVKDANYDCKNDVDLCTSSSSLALPSLITMIIAICFRMLF